MADEINVVVEVTHKVLADVLGGAARVPDELPLGHFVFHVRAGQIDGQQDEGVAQHVHGIWEGRARRNTVVRTAHPQCQAAWPRSTG